MYSLVNQNNQCYVLCCIELIFLLRSFPYLGSAHRVFDLNVLRPCAYSFLLRVCSISITPLPISVLLNVGVNPHPSFTFSLLQIIQSLSPHGLTTSVSLLFFSRLSLPHLSVGAYSHVFIPGLLNPH